jgi:hypothetical protein
MNRRDKFERLDWIIAGIFFVASLVLRVPFRSQYAYTLDSVGFAQAVADYNLRLCQPHAPGYFLYVMVARLVNAVVGDPHGSLVWMSAVSGSALAAVMYFLGAAMFGRRAGVVAGLFAASSPETWFHSCVALVYVTDSLLVCVTVLICWRSIQRGGRWTDVVAIAALLAVIAGVRGQTAPQLVPLVLFTFWHFAPPRLAKLTVLTAVTALLAVAWFIPMLKMGGGWEVYREVLRRSVEFNAPATLAGGGWNAFLWNVFFVGAYCWNGLILAGVVLVLAAVSRGLRMDATRAGTWVGENSLALQVLAAWIMPMILFATAIGFTKLPGYVLCFLPAWMLLAAAVVGQLRTVRMFCVVTVAACAMNVLAFLAWPQAWDAAFFHMGRTAREIRLHDEQLAKAIQVIRASYSPADTLICHARGYITFGMRHFQLYAPEYDEFDIETDLAMVSPVDRPMISAHKGRLEFVAGMNLTGKRIVVLVAPPGQDINRFAKAFDLSRVKPIIASDGILYSWEVDAQMIRTAESPSFHSTR